MDGADPKKLLSLVWAELLKPDTGYKHIDLSEVYTVFKHRYQLKATAIEVTDTSGHSLLFSCATMKVGSATALHDPFSPF